MFFTGAPPPPSFGVGGSVQRKNVPKPKQPLKSFNWTKLDDVSTVFFIIVCLYPQSPVCWYCKRVFLRFQLIDQSFSSFRNSIIISRYPNRTNARNWYSIRRTHQFKAILLCVTSLGCVGLFKTCVNIKHLWLLPFLVLDVLVFSSMLESMMFVYSFSE